MILQRLVPAGTALDTDDAGIREDLAAHYRRDGGRWVRMNFVVSLDGAAAAEGGSDALSSPTDRLILGVLRRQADVILVGAGSVRVEGYRRPRTAALAIVTASGDLTGHRLETGQGVHVFCPEEHASHVLAQLPEARIHPFSSSRALVNEVLSVLRSLGYDRVVCEGGPQLAAQLAAADAVDEWCLTTTPMMIGGELRLLPSGVPPRRLRLRGLLLDAEGFTYARWEPDRSTTG